MNIYNICLVSLFLFGVIQAVICPAGQTVAAGAVVCSDCPANTWKAAATADVAAGTACTPCPDKTAVAAGKGTKAEDCVATFGAALYAGFAFLFAYLLL
ncbi:hypothetical protein IMG5_142500 [Ichthyophthirius multifiliis]|uniref:Tyrosine-protein kinase ephrin type A/B receptor-like domain-containing protein n=1 Tax=Ichthyophthirius multifiliis TaxID=5932 RepID=G0QXF7_ICHMU|nr:hypothetical protein IMG5_142500 [Ichthyophthirius multifiliis]EGR30099.1 hypothetical protein IMG5_142500 [Ichthyophthirius multifiliis]|eukprot:XP_004031335.1 hypothetical protein IMG5_142500 [Ichthyophthirius multifiliis]